MNDEPTGRHIERIELVSVYDGPDALATVVILASIVAVFMLAGIGAWCLFSY